MPGGSPGPSIRDQEVHDEATAETVASRSGQLGRWPPRRTGRSTEKELNSMNVFRKGPKLAAGLTAILVIAGCTGGGTPSGSAGDGGNGEGSYTIGVSNTLTNNGWREEMICSINAQALVSGEVESLSISHRDT